MKTLLQYSKPYKAELLILTSIAFFSLFVRIILIITLKTYDISIEDNHWSFGYETGRVARSIANGDGFSSPFEPGNLPTAWVAPAYPYILAFVFKVFGIYSQVSAFIILLLNSLFSSLTCVFIYYIAKIIINPKVGLLSSIIFAVYPPAIWHSINTIWNTTLSTLLIAILILLVINTVKKHNYFWSFLCGFLMAITALTTPVIVAFYPFYFFWLYSKRNVSNAKIFINIAVIAISFLITMSPWLIRNYVVFDKFIFVKSTLGFELRLGNNPNATGTFTMKEGAALHPSLSKQEMVLFKVYKEIGYVKYSSKKARNFIFSNPQKVLLLTVKRFYLFWFGDLLNENNWLGNIKNIEKLSVLKGIFYILPIPFLLFGITMAWKNHIDISILLYLLLSYPLIYYFVHIANRYRHPIEPFAVIIGAYGMTALYEKLKGYIILNSKRQQTRFTNKIN